MWNHHQTSAVAGGGNLAAGAIQHFVAAIFLSFVKSVLRPCGTLRSRIAGARL